VLSQPECVSDRRTYSEIIVTPTSPCNTSRMEGRNWSHKDRQIPAVRIAWDEGRVKDKTKPIQVLRKRRGGQRLGDLPRGSASHVQIHTPARRPGASDRALFRASASECICQWARKGMMISFGINLDSEYKSPGERPTSFMSSVAWIFTQSLRDRIDGRGEL
jgi:hypothetical protein